MRYQEFKNQINEVTIGSKYYDEEHKSHNAYVPPLLDKIKDGGPIIVSAGGELITVTFDEKQARLAWSDLDSYIFDVTNGEKSNIKLVGTREDTGAEIKFNPTSIDKTSVKTTVNAGNVTEGVLGFALAARFGRTGQEVTEKDVITVGRTFFNSGKDEIRIKVAQRTEDALKLKVTLPKGDLKALRMLMEYEGRGDQVADELGLSTEAAKKLDKLVNQAVAYANEGSAPNSALEKIVSYYKDGVKQIISVVSDGAESENQNMTKVDLSLVVDPETGETETLSLLSLKAGSGPSQIGQASGKTYEKLSLFWKQCFAYQLPKSFATSFAKTMDANVGVDDITAAKNLVFGPIKETYEWAEEKIEGHLRGDTTEGEVDFLRHLQKGLLYHSGKDAKKGEKETFTQGSEDVIVTILNPSAKENFIELRFGEKFYTLMNYFELYTEGLQDTGSMLVLKVMVKPSANINEAPEAIQKLAKKLGAGQPLVKYRTYTQEKTVRNIVEVEKGGKILGNISNELINLDTMPSQQKPVPDAPVDQTKQTNDPNATV